MAPPSPTPNLSPPRKLWHHATPEKTSMYAFKSYINNKRNLKLDTFQQLYEYSIQRREEFWEDVLLEGEEGGLIYEGWRLGDDVTNPSARIDSHPPWFPHLSLNFAENILFTSPPSKTTPSPSTPTTSTTTKTHKQDSKIALTQVREGASSIHQITWKELRQSVGRMMNALRNKGVKKGDRIAVVGSNSFDTLVCFLGTVGLGGIISTMSTDMGVKGVLDRLSQIRPTFLFMDDWAIYNGKTTDLRSKMSSIVAGLKSVQEFKGVISMPRFSEKPADLENVPRSQKLSQFLEKATSTTTTTDDDKLVFERIKFSDPFLIVYSSGTTGQPKCIVHSVGGVLLSAKVQGRLHRGIEPDSVVLQYTTTAWIMYLSSIMSLLHGARNVMYDGSPFQPDLLTFIRLLGEQKVTHLGVSPRYMQELQKNKIIPREITDLSALRKVTSTGMVLSDALFEWFYDVGFPPAVHLANISGGTDIAGAFALENPLSPVYVGGCQGPSLGTPIAVYDSLVEGGKGVKGTPVQDGVPGELVATAAFPNMPVMFWGDNNDEKYFNAYFARFDNVWTHGDFVMVHPITKNIIFLGRADGVLNPSGVRFGSGEIYGILEAEFPQLADTICVGQRRPSDDDESVMLFLMMKPGERFTQQLVKDVKAAIRKGLSSRHVPKYVFETREIPTTVNLKKVELPVKQIVSGKVIKPSGTLLNPESLDYYYQFAKVEELVEPKSKL